MLRSSYQLNFGNQANSECTISGDKDKQIRESASPALREQYEADEVVTKNKFHREQTLAGQNHAIHGLSLEKIRLNAFKKSTNHF